MKPIVSVIIPSYNHASFLHTRIDTILNQSFVDTELIILDDNSTDTSKHIIESYKENTKISKIIINDINSGSPYQQWAKGISQAKGEWIWIAESDDWADSSFLSTLLEDVSKEVVVCFCHTHIVNNDSNIPPQSGTHVIHKGSDFVRDRMIKFPTILNASMAIFRRDAFQPDDLTSEPPLRYCQDWLFWIKLCQRGMVHEYTGKLSYFRQHSNKVSPGADRLGLNFIEGSVVWRYLRKECGYTFPLTQKVHIALRWILSCSRFSSGIKAHTISAMQIYHPDIAFLFKILQPLSLPIRYLYKIKRLIS